MTTETSILDMTDEKLVEKDIIRMSEVVPKFFWACCALSDLILLVTGYYAFAYTTPWIVGALMVAVILGFTAVELAVVRILFMLHRNQLETRILATQLPAEAASLVVRHMNPPGIK